MAATHATAEVAINTKSGLSADLPDFRDYRGMVMAATKARQAQRRNGHAQTAICRTPASRNQE